jgi:signal transduction histidine kinase
MRKLRTVRREVLVLIVTAISVAALIAAAFSSYGDPDLAGRAALARLSGEVASGVVSEWEQLRRDPSMLEGQALTWTLEPGAPERGARRLESERENLVLQALQSEARRLELVEQDLGAALDIVLEMLDRSPDEARRAAARLHAIQLAVRVDRAEVVVEQWELVRGEMNGLEVMEDTSLLLLCALAAAPALSVEERSAAQDELVHLWTSGSLALPESTFEGSALREAYRERLQALVAEASPNERLALGVQRERSRALARLAGQPIAAPSDGGWAVLALGERELLHRRRDQAMVEGQLLATGSVSARIEAAVLAADFLPEGFSIDFAGDGLAAGTVVREHVPLKAGAGGFVVRHSDPESIVSAVGERQALLRTALFVLAFGVAVAGFSVSRALRRERHLAALKSSFVANVSHELRTPVSSILLMAENLEDERVTDVETRQRYHRLIRREAERLRRLVNDVLDFSRIERGKGVQLRIARLDVRGFAQELESEARERVTDAGGSLDFELNGVPQELQADEDALRRATMNLIDNALRHSGTLGVELALEGDSSGALSIQVRDRGCGVPASRLATIFRPFERIEDSSDQLGASAGTGLGLAIVAEIAEGHGGRVEARAREGSGLIFELHIPGHSPKDET